MGLAAPRHVESFGTGIEPMSPALAGALLATGHQGSPLRDVLLFPFYRWENVGSKKLWKLLSCVRLFANSLDQTTGVGSFSLLQGNLPNPGIEPRSPTLQADSLSAEPQVKLNSTGVGSLSLLQGIFLTQESNWGLLHCRQILYQLRYQGKEIK